MSSNSRPVYNGGRPPRKDSLQNSYTNQANPSILRPRTISQTEADAESDDSGSTARSPERPAASPYPSNNRAAAASTNSVVAQPARKKISQDPPIRGPQQAMQQGHRRQHSQGYFQPSLPTTSTNIPSLSNHLSASQIAAQAAMHVQNLQSSLHARRRSQGPDHISLPHQSTGTSSRKPSTLSVQTSEHSNASSRSTSQNRAGSSTSNYGSTSAAKDGAMAAVGARSPLPSPILPQQQGFPVASPTMIQQEAKPVKEKSRMKIFSKPKALNVSGNKDGEKKSVKIQSPTRPTIYPSQTMPNSSSSNRSVVSLADSTVSGATSFYSTVNNSTSTLVPGDKSEREKRHHFLSRQRNKLKEGADHYSSAASNSRPTDPNGPQPLYSFAPSSPAPASSFNMTKSKTGFDLRHAGRALREKKREEKAAVGTFVTPANLIQEAKDREQALNDTASTFGPASTSSAHNAELLSGLGVFGLSGMTLDDAWPLLKARLLNIFEGEDIRYPIEDFNKLVLAHTKRCIQQQTPSQIIEDLRELLETGFQSLDFVLRREREDRLVLSLADTWRFCFCTALPFLEAVFQPLDLEFKGRGQLLSPKESRDFFGLLPATSNLPPSAISANLSQRQEPHLQPSHSILTVRTITLLTFRDTIILPRHETLLATFSRLPLSSLTAASPNPNELSRSPPSSYNRPDTAASSSSSGPNDPSGIGHSFNSQGSTLLDSGSAGRLGARSRATSNTSAISAASAVPSFHSVASQRRPHASSLGSGRSATAPGASSSFGALPTISPGTGAAQALPLDSSVITRVAGLMLQCVSVLGSLQAPGSLSTITSGPSARVVSPPSSRPGTAGTADAPGTLGAGTGTGTSFSTDQQQQQQYRTTSSEDAEVMAREKMQQLASELKTNWLGKSRVGGNRRGLVGTRTGVGGGLGGGGQRGSVGGLASGANTIRAGSGVGVGVGA